MISCSCSRVCGIFMSLCLYTSLVLYILTLFIDIKIKSKIMLIITIIIYVLYIFTELCSSSFSFLINKTNKDGIKEIISALVKAQPLVVFKCIIMEYYHNNKRREIDTKSLNFPYYSARDVSGLLDLSDDLFKNKTYIAITIDYEINFADEVSYMDYDNLRTDFYNKNIVSYPLSMNYEENFIISMKSDTFLFCLKEKEPCSVNFFWFIFFTIIPLAEFYNCYIDSFCESKTYIIRKLISTRYDLSQENYQIFNPSIKLFNQQYAFELNEYNYINKEYEVKIPTDSEINFASQYKDKIPKYECEYYSNINEQIKVGVVKDNPIYKLNRYTKTEIPPRSVRGVKKEENNKNNNAIIYNGLDSKNNLIIDSNINVDSVNLNENDCKTSDDQNKKLDLNKFINNENNV